MTYISSQIILVHPKFEIIELFFIASCNVIALNLLCFIFKLFLLFLNLYIVIALLVAFLLLKVIVIAFLLLFAIVFKSKKKG